MKYSELARVSALRPKQHDFAENLPKELICFCHLRWDFVYQRPQHLLSRFAADCNVSVIEEPIFEDGATPHYRISEKTAGLKILTPILPHGMQHTDVVQAQEQLVKEYLSGKNRMDMAFWYYTPMAMEFTRKFHPAIVIFDVMDELSAFKFAPPELKALEAELFERADVVFTGGYSLYQSKKKQHHNVHAFPSSIDYNHFAQARNGVAEPADQYFIPGPRLGFFGVIDERFDLDLLRESAALKPEWNFVILGPVVKIDEATLPRAANIHYLGSKNYKDLPAYLKGWDIALILFADNESTRYISPTKTPEYLAAGKPVISTPIRDVVMPYAEEGLVHICKNGTELVAIGEKILASKDKEAARLAQVDAFLDGNSWDATYQAMVQEIEKTLVV